MSRTVYLFNLNDTNPGFTGLALFPTAFGTPIGTVEIEAIAPGHFYQIEGVPCVPGAMNTQAGTMEFRHWGREQEGGEWKLLHTFDLPVTPWNS